MNLRNFLHPTSLDLRVLFISFSADGKQTYMSKHLKNASFITWSDLSLIDGELFAKKEKVSSYNFVVVGTVGSNIQLNACVEECVTRSKIGIFRYGSPTEENNKLLQTMKMRSLDVPQIKTIIARAGSLTSASLSRELGLPVISKITNGSQGKGIEKHDTKENLDKFLKKKPNETYIFQSFIPNDGDIRLFYVKDRLIYCITRKSQKEGEFRNNVSLGGKAEFIEATPVMKELGLRCVRTMGFDVTGVDLVQNKDTGEWYVMEINAAPQFWGVELAPVCNAILDYIK